MRKAILALALVALIFVSAAGGAASVYWVQSGKGYKCEGLLKSVVCKETNSKPGYSVSILPNFVVIGFGGKSIYACERGYYPKPGCFNAKG